MSIIDDNEIIIVDETKGQNLGLFCKVCSTIVGSDYESVECHKAYHCCLFCKIEYSYLAKDLNDGDVLADKIFMSDQKMLDSYKKQSRILSSDSAKFLGVE